MYCGACARDLALLRELRRAGHEVTVIPLYTPLRMDGQEPVATTAVYLSGIVAYLQQQSPLFRHLPGFVHNWLSRPGLLTWVSRFAISTRPAELGAMTVSVLAGSQGRQAEELAKLVEFLARGPRPDLVVLTNSMLSSLAPEVKRALGVPVVCGLQGEDDFVGQMPEPYRSQAQSWMRSHAASVDLFITPHEAYAGRMAEYLDLSPDRIRTVRTGVDARPYRREAPRPRDPFTIGYLSVITRAKGLDVLLEAARLLAAEGRNFRLRVAGKVLDARYMRELQATVRTAGMRDRCEFLGEVDFPGKRDFLRDVSVLAVPSRVAECRGVAALEALAAARPVVAPATGAFPEMARLTEGVTLVPPEDPAALAAALAQLRDRPEQADEQGQRGASGVAEHHSPALTTRQTVEVYREALSRLNGPTP